MSLQPARLAAALSLLSTAAMAHAQTRVMYVDQAAPAGGDGTSWPFAFNSLQAALAQVGTQYTSTDLEVRVAAGTYRATQGNAFTFSPTPTASAIVVSIKGSYFGLQSPTPNARDYVSARTTLSGDTLGNDTSDPNTRTDNAQTTLVASLPQPGTLVVDGFEIRDANAFFSNGSGLYLGSSSGGGRLLVQHCDIHANAGVDGGGIHAYLQPWWGSTPTTLEFSDCHIHANSARDYGGALWINSNAIPIRFERCVVEGNSSRNAGGIYTNQCGVRLVNSIVRGNTSNSSLAGGVYAANADIIADGCLFADNSTLGSTGGALSAQSITLSNCTIAGNRARFGGGLSATRATLTNCIVNRNTASQFGNDLYISSSFAASHTIVNMQQTNGQLPGGGYTSGDTSTISAVDPRFVSPDGPDNNAATWQDNNYRLAPDSPAIDAGEMRAGLYLLDIADQSRLVAGTPGHALALDLGCYEYPGQPRCPADVDNGNAGGNPDGAVTIDDLLYFLTRFEQGC